MAIQVWDFEANEHGKVIVSGPGKEREAVTLTSPAVWLQKAYTNNLPARLDDLLHLAALIYAADRLAKRPNTWYRHLILRLPVQDLSFWRSYEVGRRLETLLHTLTDDEWSFEYWKATSRPRAYSEHQLTIFDSARRSENAFVCLFSGGLDSLAGLAIDLIGNHFERAILVSCGTSSRLFGLQKRLHQDLQRLAAVPINPCIVPFRLAQSGSYNDNERSQRARAFFFGCLGFSVAVLTGTNRLRIYENGIGAINLPLTPAQIGAHSTRATHPFALREMEDFFACVRDDNFGLELPFLFTTKGEMCKRLRSSRLKTLVEATISCDGFPPRQSGSPHCGHCTSCLLRRQALWEGGFSIGSDHYRSDVLAVEATSDEAVNTLPLNHMLEQVHRLKMILEVANPELKLLEEFPEIHDAIDALLAKNTPDCRPKLLELYRRYCLEWQAFSNQFRLRNLAA